MKFHHFALLGVISIIGSMHARCKLFHQSTTTKQSDWDTFSSSSSSSSSSRNFGSSVEQQKITVFYNVYTAKADDVIMVKEIVEEQLRDLRPHHEVHVRSIGEQFEIPNTTRIRHDQTGDEIETLEMLWKHCYKHPASRVVYIHSKGSFHSRPENTRLRRFMTRGALSDACSFLPEACNVCSSRMSPLPHPHTSGNMWLARCSYVKKLLNPLIFQLAMEKIDYPGDVNKAAPWCLGRGRYAAEHWIHSHPSVQPCDVAGDNIAFFWGYNGVPDHEFPFNLSTAPRFPLHAHPIETCVQINMSAYSTIRRIEYEWLYGETSLKEWWDDSDASV